MVLERAIFERISDFLHQSLSHGGDFSSKIPKKAFKVFQKRFSEKFKTKDLEVVFHQKKPAVNGAVSGIQILEYYITLRLKWDPKKSLDFHYGEHLLKVDEDEVHLTVTLQEPSNLSVEKFAISYSFKDQEIISITDNLKVFLRKKGFVIPSAY